MVCRKSVFTGNFQIFGKPVVNSIDLIERLKLCTYIEHIDTSVKLTALRHYQMISSSIQNLEFKIQK